LPLPIFINGRFLAQRLAGVQRYATEMSRALLDRRPDAVILAPPDAQITLGNVRTAGKRKGQAWEQFELPRAARGGVLVNLGNTAPILARRQLVVIHDAGVFSTPEAYSSPFRLWYKTLHFALSRRGARLVTVSQFSRSQLQTHLHIDPARIEIAGEGADHMARIVADVSVLTTNGLITGKFVLAVGTLAAHKNLPALYVLAERLAAEGMVLAITGAFGAAAFGSDASLPAAAKYLGRVTDEALKALYANAACYVFPSRYEGFGLPAVEAMACGCAVVAADIPALREICGAAALYCDPASPVAIADTVMGLLADPARLAALREAAAAHVANLTWANAAAQLDVIITGLAAA
jgi:glycosyltransferase involved in cell wall biosynthesis